MRCLFLFTTLILASNFLLAAQFTDSVADPNYALCEGVGAQASGRVDIYVDYDEYSNKNIIKDLSIVGRYQTSPELTGKIIYTDDVNRLQEVSLQEPWYSVIRQPGSTSLTNPQVSSTTTPGIGDKRLLDVKKDSDITIKLVVIHAADGGNCPTSFSHTFKL